MLSILKNSGLDPSVSCTKKSEKQFLILIDIKIAQEFIAKTLKDFCCTLNFLPRVEISFSAISKLTPF